MHNIHRTILLRLCLAWLSISAVVATGAFYLETEKIDERVVELALGASQRFYSEPMDLASPQAREALQRRAAEYAGDHFVVVELYDAAKNKIVEAVSPAYAALEKKLSRNTHGFPMDGGVHYQKSEHDRHIVVQVLVPVRAPEGGAVTGYFEGVYVVDDATMLALRNSMRRAILVALVTVFLTTLILYPVILALNRRVLRYSRRVMQGNIEMATVLGAAIAQRDSDTSDHNYRVTLYATRLGTAAGVHGLGMRGLIMGAFLHDVGKIGISDNILLKPGPLDPEEFEIMRSHVARGVHIIAGSEWLQQARDVIEFHHEKWSGGGYLRGLAGEEIPLNARVFAIVDVFDALTSRRPYKDPMSLEAALEVLRRDAGSHFDPQLVELFVGLAPRAYADIAHADTATLGAQLLDFIVPYYELLPDEV